MPDNRIPEQLLASYIDGNTTDDQQSEVSQLLAQSDEALSEYLIAAKATYLFDDVNEPDESQVTKLGFAAGSASLIAGGAGLAAYISNLAQSVPFFGSSDEIVADNDRYQTQPNSIHENLKYKIMDTSNQPLDFNPVQQQYDDTCAIKSQQLILNDFGFNVSEDQLVQQAEQYNIYTPGSGTSPEDVGKLLELNGVPCTQHSNATIYDLTSALAQGEKVIIGVDSNELWNNGPLSQFVNQATDQLSGEQANHALIVAGIDTSDPNDVQVILTDPGTGEEAARYPMEQFLDAWHDSGNFMVTTDAPAPLAYNPEMINFDYSQGHIPMIGEMPYEYFEQAVLPLSHGLNDYPVAMELLNNDFDGMVGGEITALSPELVNTLALIPDFDFNAVGIDPYSPDGFSFGSSHMADYYNGWAEQHEKLAQYDIDHGNLDSAQNHLRYADDAHDHAMDELNDID